MDNRKISLEIIEKVRAYIEAQRLFPPVTPLLVAVSGGVDSMTAVHLLHGLGYPVSIAHCNFALRGEASDKDQEFVANAAAELDLPFHTVRFDTEGYASTNNISIQEAARIQRYQWLEETRKENGCHFVITGHHMMDNTETVLYNLTKNTGLRGLHGIRPKRDKIARPLLCLRWEEIRDYASENNIAFREDATNTSVKYSRNFIRHKILPELKEINPKVIEAIDALSRKVAEAESLMDERLVQIRRKVLLKTDYAWELKFGYVLQHPAGRTILFEMLKDFNFNEDQVNEIYSGLKGKTGAEYLSSSHRVLKDRRSLFIQALDAERETVRQYNSIPDQILFNNYKIQVRVAPVDKVVMKRNSNYAYLDLDKVNLPLTIRYWKAGDYFYPFGLTKDHSDKIGKKKLSKYFKDEKVPVHEKETTPVLFAGEHLIWLVGHRIDHRFRVTEETKNVLKMKIVRS